MAANCKAGICFTPSLEASQVVPQKKLTQIKASMGNPMAAKRLFADWCRFVIFANLKRIYNESIVQNFFDFCTADAFF